MGSFSAVAVALLLLAKPSFNDVAKKFPSATLPFTIAPHPDPLPADAGRGGLPVKLSVADVRALGIENDELLTAWRKEKKSLFALARVQRTGHQLLFLRFEQPTQQDTYLFSFSDTGAYLGAMPFSVQLTTDEVVMTNVSTLTQAGAIARVFRITRPIREPGLPTESVVTAELRGKVTSTGTLELMPMFFGSRTGKYSHGDETFLVFDKRVFRRAKREGAFVEMIGDGTNMRMPDEVKTWTLTWNERRTEISALTPAGDLKNFVREW